MAVLAEVDVDLSAPVAERPGDGRDVRLRLHPQHGEQARERSHFVVGIVRPERDQDVEPGGP